MGKRFKNMMLLCCNLKGKVDYICLNLNIHCTVKGKLYITVSFVKTVIVASMTHEMKCFVCVQVHEFPH